MTPLLRRLTLALAISVGLNLFAGGFVVARMLRHPPHSEGFGPHAMAGPMGILEDIDNPDARERVRRTLSGRMDHFERGRGKMRNAREKVAQAMEREPPDAVELGAAFSDLREATTEAQAEIHSTLIEVAPTLTRQQRADLMRKWARGPRHRRTHPH